MLFFKSQAVGSIKAIKMISKFSGIDYINIEREFVEQA